MTGIVRRKGRRRNVVAPAPDLHLRFAMLRRGLGLIQALQRAVMAFVEPPRAMDRNSEEVHLVKCDPQRADGALQHRRMRDVELEFFGGHHPAGLARFLAALVAQVDVGPPGKSVFTVPRAFAVAKENESEHGRIYEFDLTDWRMASCGIAAVPAYVPRAPSSSSIRNS